MDPNSTTNPSFELPVPGETPTGGSPELAPMPEIQAGPASGQPSMPPLPSLPPLRDDPSAMPHLASPALPTSLPGTNIPDENTDLIDKQWIEKAKQIIEQTRSDPYNQNKKVNEVKSDYMRKHFNKDIKVND